MLGIYAPIEVWDIRTVCAECKEHVNDADFVRVGLSEDADDECCYCGRRAVARLPDGKADSDG